MPKSKHSRKADKPWSSVADNLRILLAIRNMSRDELARRMNVTTVTVGRWIKGKSLPPTAALWHLAEILNVPVTTLVAPVEVHSENCTRLIC